MRNLFVVAVACMLAACAQREPVKLYSGAEQPTPRIPATRLTTLSRASVVTARSSRRFRT